jgi:uncharacterized 2Fe-2S/4Fe-4S cluster protein (DUF4445 family)
MNGEVSIRFLPQGKKVSVSSDSTILEAAQCSEVMIDSICGGRGRCEKCLVKDLSGKAAEPTEREKELLSPQQVVEGFRLACQSRVREGLEVRVVQETAEQGLRGKEIGGTSLNGLESRISKKYIELTPPSEKDRASDWNRITRALPETKQISLETLKKIPELLREKDFGLTLTLFKDEILTVRAGYSDSKGYGLAVDLGTTTVAAYLVDLESNRIIASGASLNKQSSLGADVISRLSAATEETGGLEKLKKAAATTINEIIEGLVAEHRTVWENIHLVTAVGNPTMMHLFLGINPRGLAGFPFTPAFSDLLTLPASETGLSLPGHSKLEILPLISAYVGADTVAAAVTADMDTPDPPRLLLDIGTNGEVVLACKDKIWACSTAAGPALEGGAIKFGMRAGPGAISAVTISEDVKVTVMGAGAARGICGSGLLDAVAQMLERGLINKTGRLKDGKTLPESIPPAIRSRLMPGERGQNFYLAPEVFLTQGDISQLQLAKGAMRAGIEILMAEAGITPEDLEEVLLAGAFGASLNPKSLVTVGLLPPFPLEKVKAIGNAAGLGAVLCLLSETHHRRALALARKINHLELSLQKNFQEMFIQGIKF